MNIRRLTTLANFLETKEFPEGKFDLNRWMSGLGDILKSGENNSLTRSAALKRFKEDPTLEQKPAFKGDHDDRQPIHCRTAGCALGWAATIPSFRRAGLRLSGGSNSIDAITIPEYHGWTGFHAAASFFSLDITTAVNLFSTSAYPYNQWRNPKAVAKRIRSVIKEHEKNAARSRPIFG